MAEFSKSISLAVAAMQEAQACQSAALEAVVRLKELDPDPDGPLSAAVAHFRELRVQAYYAERAIRDRLPVGVLESLEGPREPACVT